MVKFSKQDTLKIISSIKKMLSKLYTKRDKAKEKIKSNRLWPRVQEVVRKFNQKSRFKEEKLKKRVISQVLDNKLRNKILNKLKRGMDDIHIPDTMITLQSYYMFVNLRLLVDIHIFQSALHSDFCSHQCQYFENAMYWVRCSECRLMWSLWNDVFVIILNEW